MSIQSIWTSASSALIYLFAFLYNPISAVFLELQHILYLHDIHWLFLFQRFQIKSSKGGDSG